MASFTRDFYIGHPVDDSSTFEETANEIMGFDDVNKLHDYLKVFTTNYHYPAFLDMCLDRGATKCALHIIEGKLPHGPPKLCSDHLEPKPDHPVLYLVIHTMCEPHVFHLLFTHCEAVNQVNQPFHGLFPLQWLLSLLEDIPPLSDWSPGKPLSMLIDSLFGSEVRPKLECARMLAQHTHSLDQIALGFIQNEEIIALAALLLVAPFTLADFETIKSYTSIKSAVSQAIHGQSFTPATYCAAALLSIFEKDGDKLTAKFNNPQEGYTQAGKGDQSFVNLLIPQPQKRLVQISKGAQSIANHSIQQIGTTTFMRRLLSTDANLSSNHYLSLHSLLKESEGNDTLWLLQEYLSRVNEEALHSGGGLLALVSAIRTCCNNNDIATEHSKSCDARHVNLTYMHLLHFVLGSLVKYDYLSKWSPSQSLVKLILLLFLQRELKPTLECAQLVAKRTNSVNEAALNLIQQGELIQLAGLLLVAREKAIEPFDSGDTIKEATSTGIVSQVVRGESVTAMTGAAGLLEIFEVAGDALAKYWSIHNDEHEPVGVIIEVAKIIQHSGIQVLSTDVDLTDIYGASSHPEMLKSICERLGIKVDNTSGLSQISRESVFPSAKSVKERCHIVVPLCKDPLYDWDELEDDTNKCHDKQFLGRYELTEIQKIPNERRVGRSQGFDNLGSRAFCTSTRIADKVRGGTLKHSSAWPSPSPSPSPSPVVRDLGYLAMKLKRGVRLL